MTTATTTRLDPPTVTTDTGRLTALDLDPIYIRQRWALRAQQSPGTAHLELGEWADELRSSLPPWRAERLVVRRRGIRPPAIGDVESDLAIVYVCRPRTLGPQTTWTNPCPDQNDGSIRPLRLPFFGAAGCL